MSESLKKKLGKGKGVSQGKWGRWTILLYYELYVELYYAVQ